MLSMSKKSNSGGSRSSLLLSIPVSIFILILSVQVPGTLQAGSPCVPKIIGHIHDLRIVCVCNGTYCDTLEGPAEQVPSGQIYHLVSSRSGKRFHESIIHADSGTTQEEEPASLYDILGWKTKVKVRIDQSKVYQKMIGFGGAFTDASGLNLKALSSPLQQKIIKSYFGKDGLEYGIGRVPIAGTDFSTHPYSYCDKFNDSSLETFALTMEDLQYKIPYIQEALALRPDLKLFGSPWSPPKWMKSNGEFNGRSSLIPEFYQSWANYFVKFFQEYQKAGITFWGLTPQNEPLHGVVGSPWNSLGWFPETQTQFIKNNLGPALEKAGLGSLKLIINDDNRYAVVSFARAILGDPDAAKYVSGIGLHWYANSLWPTWSLDTVHKEFPDYFMLNTEACNGFLHFLPGVQSVILGSWERAENYADNIIQDLNHWLSGWVEWNLVLDMEGGPNWAKNYVDAPIIVNNATDEAYKQPMWYALGHFSKFIPEGSFRIHHVATSSWWWGSAGLKVLTVRRPDDQVVVVIYNESNNWVQLTIEDVQTGGSGSFQVKVEPRSINTFLYSSLKKP